MSTPQAREAKNKKGTRPTSSSPSSAAASSAAANEKHLLDRMRKIGPRIQPINAMAAAAAAGDLAALRRLLVTHDVDEGEGEGPTALLFAR